jgi:hypothetical protein
MKELSEDIYCYTRMIDVCLLANQHCRIDGLRRRVITGRVAGSSLELVVVVAAAHPGYVFGHVMFDAAADQWMSFLIHSNAIFDLADGGCELATYRRLIIDEQNYSLVYSYDGAPTSARVDVFGGAVRAICDMISGFEPDAVWPESPGPFHQLDFAPFDAYGFIERQSR